MSAKYVMQKYMFKTKIKKNTTDGGAEKEKTKK